MPHRARRIAEIDWQSWTAVDQATLLFVVRDDRILLIRKKRGLGAGKINGPGGRLEPGETPMRGAIREVQEEVCVTAGGIRWHGELEFQFVDGYSIHVQVFRASDFTGSPTETAEATPVWFEIDRIPYDEMWADNVLWLPMLLQGKRFFGRFIFDGDAMLDHTIHELDHTIHELVEETTWSG